jgi:ABC-type transporter Mla maintaining outer membrane lipid asymmetry ATPase subunit MlaF
MVDLEELRVGGHGPWSFHVDEGESVAVVAESAWGREALLALLAGRRAPRSGRLTLLGEELYALPRTKALALFREVGVVPENGGLISNLRAWQNILLPASYHAGLTVAQVSGRVEGYFEQLGLSGDALASCLDSQPGVLPQHWRRLVGLVRALVMEPRVLVYEAVLEGLPPRLALAVAELTATFHAEQRGRVSLFITTDVAGTQHVPARRRIDLRGE